MLTTIDDRSRRVAGDGLVLLVVVAATACLLTLVEGLIHHNGMIDLGVYRKGAWAFVHGRSPFGTRLPGPHLPFTYTPFSSVVFAPLTYLSMHVAMVVHTFVSLCALCLSCWIVLERARPGRMAVSHLVALVAGAAVVVFFSEPVLQTLGFGQINLVLMAMVLLDLVALGSRRWSGVLLGIAAGIKLTPIVFIAYLVVVRRTRAAVVASISAAATVALGWVLMPGPSRTYFTSLMWNERRVGNVEYVGNQSLNGMWTRILHGDVAARPYWALSALVVGVLGMGVAWLVHERFGEPAGVATAAVVGLLVSPISWSHHWVWWMVPAFLLATEAWRSRSVRAGALAFAWSLPFYVAPFWFVPHRNHRTYPHGLVQQLAASAYVVVGLVGLTVTGVWLVRARRRAAIPAAWSPAGASTGG
jgi:alpha-1,2-mannosyltransferase